MRPQRPRTPRFPARLLGAGAVAVGKSTLPEFAIEGYTANLLTGVTRNPWNPAYSPGGSSGGFRERARRGTRTHWNRNDGGGSVRIPASLCGLVGLKTNQRGRRALAHARLDRLFHRRTLATSCDDLALLFDVMRGPTPGDPNAPTVAMLDAMAHRRDQPITLLRGRAHVSSRRLTPRMSPHSLLTPSPQ